MSDLSYLRGSDSYRHPNHPSNHPADIEYATLRRGFYVRTVMKMVLLYAFLSWIAGLVVEMTQGMFYSRAVTESIVATLPWVGWGLVVGLFTGFLFAELSDTYADRLREMEQRAERRRR